MHVDSFFHEETITLSHDHTTMIGEEKKTDQSSTPCGTALFNPCTLHRWSDTVTVMTHLEKRAHLKEPYIALVEKLRK